MGRKRKKRDPESQMTFDFGTYLSAEGGEVKGRDTRGQGSQKPVKRELEPADREDLMEKVADLGNLVRAWKRVKANKGADPCPRFWRTSSSTNSTRNWSAEDTGSVGMPMTATSTSGHGRRGNG